jgi:hypothetical protein
VIIAPHVRLLRQAATYREWLAQAQRTASDLGGSV